MSSTNKYNTTYSATDIERYLKGELSPREMHDLENAALEDPFLADALDGMSDIADTGLSRDLDELHTRLNARVAAGPDRAKIRRLVPRWSIAASIILLLGIGYAIYYTSFTSPRSPAVASSPPPAEANATAKEASPPPAEANATAKEASPPPPEAVAPAQEPSPSPSAPAKPASLAKATAPAPPAKQAREEDKKETFSANADAETKADKKAEPHADTVAGTYATADIGPKLLAASISRQFRGRVGGLRLDSLVFKGIVLDNHNNPVQGASLILKGYTNAGTVTDNQGQFSLNLSPQDSTRYVTVAMIGYEQKSLPLNTLIGDNGMTGHVIYLQPNEASMDEVVVTGFASKRKETRAAAPSIIGEELDSLWLKAYPVIGRAAYLHYLDTARKVLTDDSAVRGTESVSFEVDKKGTLTAFKIEQSLSPAYDEAIIRLVKEGAAWQLLRQKKARVVVSLHF
jgi:CarboxypepD_reg-like domain